MTKPNTIIMIDTETLGQTASAVTLQLALIAVDASDADVIIREAEEYLPIQPQLKLGRTIDADTILWWMKQPDAARARMDRNKGNDMDELTALVTSIYRKIKEIVDESADVEIMSRGSQFDFPIIESLFDMCGLPENPYDFRKVRDLRSIMSEAGVDVSDVPVRGGLVKHHALSDCRFQLDCLFEARRRMRTAS